MNDDDDGEPAEASLAFELTLEGLYAIAKEKGLLADGWQSSGECIWNALHVVILQAASRIKETTDREREIADVLDRLVSDCNPSGLERRVTEFAQELRQDTRPTISEMCGLPEDHYDRTI